MSRVRYGSMSLTTGLPCMYSTRSCGKLFRTASKACGSLNLLRDTSNVFKLSQKLRDSMELTWLSLLWPMYSVVRLAKRSKPIVFWSWLWDTSRMTSWLRCSMPCKSLSELFCRKRHLSWSFIWASPIPICVKWLWSSHKDRICVYSSSDSIFRKPKCKPKCFINGHVMD